MTRLLALGLAVLLLSSAGCASQDTQGSAQARLQAWVSGTAFGGTVALLQHDSANIARGLREHRDRNTLQTLCAILLTDAEAANANLPAPDRAVSVSASNGYALLGAGAHHCFAAGGSDVALDRRSAAERGAGLIALARAISRAEAVTGGPVPTTLAADGTNGLQSGA